MLRIMVPSEERFDEKTSKFVMMEGFTIDLEHSLVSVSKWESKWEIPFLDGEKRTGEQSRDYIRMMILGEIPPEEKLSRLSGEHISKITDYINAKMTATWFREWERPKSRGEIITSEIIYYWMISFGIPFETQNWHLNRLLTLIRVCGIKNSPKKKMSRSESIAQQRELNAQRRATSGSRG